MNENVYMVHRNFHTKVACQVHSARYTQYIYAGSHKLKLPKYIHTSKVQTLATPPSPPPRVTSHTEYRTRQVAGESLCVCVCVSVCVCVCGIVSRACVSADCGAREMGRRDWCWLGPLGGPASGAFSHSPRFVTDSCACHCVG